MKLSWLPAEHDRSLSLFYRDTFIDAVYEFLMAREAEGNTVVSAVLGMNPIDPVLEVIYTNRYVDDGERDRSVWHSRQRKARIGGRDVIVNATRLDSFWAGVTGGVAGPGPVEYLMHVASGVVLVRDEQMEAAALMTLRHSDFASFSQDRLAAAIMSMPEAFEEMSPRFVKWVVRDIAMGLRPAATAALSGLLLSQVSKFDTVFEAIRTSEKDIEAFPSILAVAAALATLRFNQYGKDELMRRSADFATLCRSSAGASLTDVTSPGMGSNSWKSDWCTSLESVFEEIHRAVTGRDRNYLLHMKGAFFSQPRQLSAA